jgi:hypothetical protein
MIHVIAPEEATAKAFIVRVRRRRFLELLQSHGASIAKLLRAKGAGRSCRIISEDKRIISLIQNPWTLLAVPRSTLTEIEVRICSLFARTAFRE